MSFYKFFFNSRVTTYEQHKTELFLIPLLVFTLIVKCFLFARYTRSQFKCSTDLCIENPTNPRTISVCYPFWLGVALSFQQRILTYTSSVVRYLSNLVTCCRPIRCHIFHYSYLLCCELLLGCVCE